MKGGRERENEGEGARERGGERERGEKTTGCEPLRESQTVVAGEEGDVQSARGGGGGVSNFLVVSDSLPPTKPRWTTKATSARNAQVLGIRLGM